MKIGAIIILYNKLVIESTAFKSLSKQECSILIFDNSDKTELRHKNEIICSDLNISYFTKNKNVGLSKGYNHVIKETDFDYYLTSDDDTAYPMNYLSYFFEASEKEAKTKVFFPIIQKIDGHVIPSRNWQFKKFIPCNPFPSRKTGYYRPINSGVIYQKSIFDTIQFDENLLVENIDFKIFDDLKRKRIKQSPLNIKLVQNYSSFEERAKSGGRIEKTAGDQFYYYGKLVYFTMFITHMDAYIRFRKFEYLKLYFKVFVKNRKNYL